MGVIAYLAHIGCFVPARAARLGLVDRIFTRILSEESASVCSSYFMLGTDDLFICVFAFDLLFLLIAFSLRSAIAIDCIQVVSALRSFTPRSLLLIDEFGKGTATGSSN